MIRTRLAAFLAAVLAGSPAADCRVASQGLHFQGRTRPFDDLPAELTPAARSAVETWIPWAERAGYRMTLGDDQRVLVLTYGARSGLERTSQLVDRVSAVFEASLPRTELPPEAPPPDVATPAPPADGPLPEDPEGGPAPWEEIGLGRYESPEVPTWSFTWGAADMPPDASTAVFLVVEDDGDFLAVLDFLKEGFPYLEAWAEDAGRFSGFTLQQPLAGAFVEGASGQEEWNPDNEVVNRIAQLLLLRRFGQQPNWLVQAWAWHCEFAVLGAVYCFPYRDEFVGVGEHGGWERDVRNLFKVREKKPLRPSEFADWERGTYEHSTARISWGLLEFVLHEHPGKLPLVAEEFRVHVDRENRVDHGDGTWSRNVDFVIPPERQVELLEKHLGKGFLKDATRFFREAEDYEPRPE